MRRFFYVKLFNYVAFFRFCFIVNYRKFVALINRLIPAEHLSHRLNAVNYADVPALFFFNFEYKRFFKAFDFDKYFIQMSCFCKRAYACADISRIITSYYVPYAFTSFSGLILITFVLMTFAIKKILH